MGEVHSCLASCDAKRNGAKIKAREVPQQGDFPIDKRVPVRAPCYLLSAPLTRGQEGSPRLAALESFRLSEGRLGSTASFDFLFLRFCPRLPRIDAFGATLEVQVELSAASAVNPSVNSYDTKSWASSSVCPFLCVWSMMIAQPELQHRHTRLKHCDDTCESSPSRRLRRKRSELAPILGARSRPTATGWK